jgi:hypothetical protein
MTETQTAIREARAILARASKRGDRTGFEAARSLLRDLNADRVREVAADPFAGMPREVERRDGFDLSGYCPDVTAEDAI